MGGRFFAPRSIDINHRSDKPITPALQSFNKNRILGRIRESFPQPPNCCVQTVVEINKGVLRPESATELLAGHNLSRALQKDGQDLKWLRLEFEPAPLLSKLARTQIRFEQSESDHAWWIDLGFSDFGELGIHLTAEKLGEV